MEIIFHDDILHKYFLSICIFSSFTLLPHIIKAAAHYLNHNRDLELLEIIMRLTRRLNLGFLLSEKYDTYISLHNTVCFL